MQNDYLKIGLIGSSHGVRGEINIKPLTDEPSRFKKLKDVVILDPRGSYMTEVKVLGVSITDKKTIIKLEGIESADDCIKYRNHFLAVARKDAIKLPKDSYFICDLISCAVYKSSGELLGELVDVLETGGHDIYAVKRKGLKDLLIPGVKAFIKEVDLENKKIIVDLPEGLEDL